MDDGTGGIGRLLALSRLDSSSAFGCPSGAGRLGSWVARRMRQRTETETETEIAMQLR